MYPERDDLAVEDPPLVDSGFGLGMSKDGNGLVWSCAQFLLVGMIGEAVREEDGIYLAALEPRLKLGKVGVSRGNDVRLAAEEREVVDLRACPDHHGSRRGNESVRGARAAPMAPRIRHGNIVESAPASHGSMTR